MWPMCDFRWLELGIDIGGQMPLSRNVEGVGEMMLDAMQHYAAPL